MGTRHRTYRNDELVYDWTEPDVGQPPGGGGGGEVPPGGGTPPGGSGLPPVSGGVITSKPQAFADGGTNMGAPAQIYVAKDQVVGMDFEVVPSYSRNLQWFGAPGDFFSSSSWAIFDAVGVKVMGRDNSEYEKVQDTDNLGLLPPGRYTFAVAVNASGPLAIQWQQS